MNGLSKHNSFILKSDENEIKKYIKGCFVIYLTLISGVYFIIFYFNVFQV